MLISREAWNQTKDLALGSEGGTATGRDEKLEKVMCLKVSNQRFQEQLGPSRSEFASSFHAARFIILQLASSKHRPQICSLISTEPLATPVLGFGKCKEFRFVAWAWCRILNTRALISFAVDLILELTMTRLGFSCKGSMAHLVQFVGPIWLPEECWTEKQEC